VDLEHVIVDLDRLLVRGTIVGISGVVSGVVSGVAVEVFDVMMTV
jgi:hypothetical protein